MSSDKKVLKPKVVKVLKEPKKVEPVPEEPKKRTRAKKPQPTKEEMMQGLKATSDELKQIVVDLKDDETKVNSSGIQFKHLPELIKTTIQNLEDDCADIDEKYEELKSQPVEQSSN